MVTVPRQNRAVAAQGSGAAAAAPHGARMMGPAMDAHVQGAGGSWKAGWHLKVGLDQRCREMRDLVTLQAQGMKIFSQSCEEKLRQNRERLPSLQQALQEDTRVLDFVLKTNKLPADDAFAEAQAVAAAPEDLEVVQKRLEAIVHGQVKVCDLLQHQVKQWTKIRDDGQRYLEQLQDAEMDDTLAQPQLQKIRQLGNEIEKMLMKIHTGQRVNNHYLQLRDSLKNELLSVPQYLDLMCGMTEMYNEELTAWQNPEAADVVRKLMAEARPQLLMERSLQAQALAEQRAHIQSLQRKIESERELREHAASVLSTDQAQASLDTMTSADVEAAMTRMEHEAFVNEKMEKAKAVLQCSSIWDIPSSLLAQQKTLGDLEKYIQESKESERVLKQMLEELELKHTKLKFHQPLDTTRLQEEELRTKLKQEEARRDRLQAQLMRNQEQLIDFENGVDNLFIRLRGIAVPGQEESVKPTGVEEKLQQCAEKLLYLKQRVLDHPVVAQTDDKSSKTSEIIRDLLEKSVAAETQNLKISFEDEDAIDHDFLDAEEEDDDYIPSREDIKNQGLQLIEMNTKYPKRK